MRRLMIGPVLAVLTMAVIAVIVVPDASARSTAALRVSGPRRIAPRGVAFVVGRLTGVRGGRVQLRVISGGRPLRHRPIRVGHGGRFLLEVRASATAPAIRARVVASSGRRPVTSRVIRPIHVTHAAPTTASPTTSATVVPAASFVSVPAPGTPGQVVLSGRPQIAVGTVLAGAVGPSTPSGFLGRVTAISRAHGRTMIHTVPATLEEAVPEGSFDLAASTQVDSDGQPIAGNSAPRSTGRSSAGSASFKKQIADNISCSGGATLAAGGDVTLSATPQLKAHWSFVNGITASFQEQVSASASLSATVSGVAECSLARTHLFKEPVSLGKYEGEVAGIPVEVTLEGQIYLDGRASAKGAATIGIEGGATASGGISYAHGHASIIPPLAGLKYGPVGPTAAASASVGAHLTPELSVLLYGAGGPVFDATTGLDFTADTTKNPWWTLTAPLRVTASLEVPSLGLSTGDLTLYHRDFPIANAPGGFGAAPAPTPAPAPAPAPEPAPTPAPAPTLVVPAIGPTVVDQEDTEGSPTDGDRDFEDWGAATSQPVDIVDSLPASLSGDRCVVLDLNQSFAGGDEAELSQYLQAGGTVVALGEHGGFDDADDAINGLLSQLGSSMSLNEDSLGEDEGDLSTDEIHASPLTSGVSEIGYNWASSLELGSGSTDLVDDADYDEPIVASQSIRAGTLVLTGDSNIFSDEDGAGYVDDDNGTFVTDICP